MEYKKCALLLILTIFLLSISAAYAMDSGHAESKDEILADNPKTFTQLSLDINASANTFDIHSDYAFSSESDDSYVIIDKNNFTINGNNHVIDGNDKSRIFFISGGNITINDLLFINANFTQGGAIYSLGNITLNNVTFISNTANRGGSVYIDFGELNCFDCKFIDGNSSYGSAIYSSNSNTNIENSYFTSKYLDTRGSVYSRYGNLSIKDSIFTDISSNRLASVYALYGDLFIDNCLFTNITSKNAAAIFSQNCRVFVNNSRFSNLKSNISAAAMGLNEFKECEIENCTFVNLTSHNNAGAIFAEAEDENKSAAIKNSEFVDCSSGFGGAIVYLEGILSITDSKFVNNTAEYYGGAIYTSFVNLNIINSSLTGNRGENYTVLYFDNGKLFIVNSTLTDNKALNSSEPVYALYLNDAVAKIENSTIDNGEFNIYGNFVKSYESLNNALDEGSVSIDNQNYIYYVENTGVVLNLTNNLLISEEYPSRFDLREMDLDTPVKYQGMMGSCWVFSVIESLESALLRATGLEYDFSENNVQDLEIKYYPTGSTTSTEGGYELWSLNHALSGYGVVPENEDIYDELGKVSRYLESENRIHLQDAYFVMPNSTDYINNLKKGIFNFGAVTIDYKSAQNAPYFNVNTSAHYVNESISASHQLQ